MSIKNTISNTLGLRGTWKWALRQMEAGRIVRPASALGTIKYKLDNPQNQRIVWDFSDNKEDSNWSSSNIFLKTLKRTDWEVFEWDNNLPQFY